MTRHWFAPFVLLAALSAQTASVTSYGTGCGANAAITWNGLPRLGQTVTFVYSGINSYLDTHGVLGQYRPVFLLGVSDQGLGALQLPFQLPLGMTNGRAGCFLLQSSEVAMVMPFDPSSLIRFVDHVAVPIPNDPALLGGVFFAQWLVWLRYRRSWNEPILEWVWMADAARATIGT